MSVIKVTIDTKAVEKMFGELLTNFKGVDEDFQEFGKDVASTAYLRAPVDTGYLRNSIRHERLGLGRVMIEASAPYASYVEFGTTKMRPQPYMMPAVRIHTPRLLQNIKRRLEGK